METIGDFIQTYRTWLALLLIPISIAAVYALGLLWRKQSLRWLKELRRGLRPIDDCRNQAIDRLEWHSPQDPEPYGSRVSDLKFQTDQFEQRYQDFIKGYIAIQQRTSLLCARRLDMIVKAPVEWFKVRRAIYRLRRSINELEHESELTWNLLERVDHISLDVARDARKARTVHREAHVLIRELQTRNLLGDAMDDARQKERELDLALRHLPETFFKADEIILQQPVDKQIVIQNFALLQSAMPVLDNLLARLKDWWGRYQDTVSKIDELKNVLNSIDLLLTDTPQALDLSEYQTLFQQFMQISQGLQMTLTRLEIESMQSVAGEAVRLTKLAKDLEASARRSRQSYAALIEAMNSLQQGLQELSNQFSDLATQKTYPMSWGPSSAWLAKLLQQAAALKPLTAQRAPDEVDHDLQQTNRLNQQRLELEKAYRRAAQQRQTLVQLFEKPQLRQGKQWIQRALELIPQTERFSLENWPEVDHLASLKMDVQMFEADFQRLVPQKPEEALREEELAPRPEMTAQLAETGERLNRRVANIQQRLDEIQRLESRSMEKVEASRLHLSQVSFLVRSNPFLSQIAAQDAARFQTQLDQLQESLAQRQQGTLEKKSRQVDLWHARVDEAVTRWLHEIGKDISKQADQLSNDLSYLNAIAALDDAAASSAYHLLVDRSNYQSSAEEMLQSRRLDTILPELKKRCDYWQKCVAALNQLADLKKEISRSYDAASATRLEAIAMVKELSSEASQSQGWPPVAFSVKQERKELEAIEVEWSGLKQKKVSGISLVASLGELSGKYRELIGKLRSLRDRLESERRQFFRLESELDHHLQMWQRQYIAYRDKNPTAAGEIQELLAATDRERETIHQEYTQGKKDQAETLKSMQQLVRKVRLYLIAIDDDHAGDINGRVIANQ